MLTLYGLESIVLKWGVLKGDAGRLDYGSYKAVTHLVFVAVALDLRIRTLSVARGRKPRDARRTLVKNKIC